MTTLRELSEQLRSRLDVVRRGGSEAARAKHVSSREGCLAKKSWNALKPWKEDPITTLPDGKGGHASNFQEMHALTYKDCAAILFRDDMPEVAV